MDLYERIKEVASAKGISINKLEKDLNLPRSSVRKYSKNKPSAERIGTIADYLGVSADYLINGNVDTSEGVQTDVQVPSYYIDAETRALAQELHDNPELSVMLDAYKTLSPRDAKLVMEMVRRMQNEGTN